MAKRKLLLADDSVTIQKVVGISFANEDVEIVTVDNGDDALARAREVRPDIVLADIVMPGKNGYQVCEALKNDPALAHVPVLLLTGTFEAFDEERARQVRADGHITKPFEAQALVDHVNRLLTRSTRPAPPARPVAPPPPPAAPPRPIAAPVAPAPAPAAPPAAPPPQVVGEEAFDFFEDDVDGMASAPESAESETPATTAFELDAGESAFDFAPVIDEPAPRSASDMPTAIASPPPPRPSAAPSAEQTVAMLPQDADDDWPEGDDLEAAFGEPSPRTPAPAPRSAPSFAESESDRPTVLDFAQPAAADAHEPGGELEFGFDDFARTDPAPQGLDDLDAPDTARATFLDPDTDQAFAVSSSDLGESLAVASAAFQRPPEPPARPELVRPSETGPLTEPLAAPPPRGAAGTPDIGPLVREQLHDALEKIAWEAFADLPEQIVRQAVAKIEEIAWEVIPQMAESLIRDEIRRLKGEPE